MKKYFLGFTIVVIFLVYTYVLRNQHSEPIVAPTVSSQNDNNATSGESNTTSPAPSSSTLVAQYKDGTFTGSIANAYYGNVQVAATISDGKITNIAFLQYPDENPNSIYVNTSAIPYLKQEAIKAQSSKLSGVTGATYTSQAFTQSLANALSQAKQG